MLVRLAGDDRAPQRTRRQAVFGLGQAAGDAATKDLTDLVDDADLDRDVKEQAVFALSQQPRDAGVPALIRSPEHTRSRACGARRCSGSASPATRAPSRSSR